MWTDGRPDGQIALCSIAPGHSAALDTSYSPLHARTHWIVGRQKRRALDSFKRIKEEKHIGVIYKSAKSWTRDVNSVAWGLRGWTMPWVFFVLFWFFCEWNQFFLNIYCLPFLSFRNIGFEFQMSAARGAEAWLLFSWKSKEVSGYFSRLCWFSHQLQQQQQQQSW